MDNVHDWMNDLVVFIDPDSLVIDALHIMRRRYINSLITKKTSSSPEYGIITSIDICDKIVAQERDPAKIKVFEVMSTPLITVSPDLKVIECARLMKEKRIHHLPVANESSEIIGMISANDFLVIAEAGIHGLSQRSLS